MKQIHYCSHVVYLGHLCLDLEQIATEFIFAWLVSIYSLIIQKKNQKKSTSQGGICLKLDVSYASPCLT